MTFAVETPDVARLIEPDRVHRAVYIDPDIFELEMERIWGRAWIYVGHASQVPAPGDYFATEIGREPIIMVRDGDGSIHVLSNRCAHKGAKLVSARSGNVRNFYCSYHGWSYRTDGSLVSVPLRSGYDNTCFSLEDPAFSLRHLPRVDQYRGFVFASLSGEGPDLRSFLGGAAVAFDDMIDRAPDGEVECAGSCARSIQHSNWKFFLENQLDGVHAGIVHTSSVQAATEVVRARYGKLEPPLALKILAAQTPPDPDSIWPKLNSANFPYGHSNFLGYQEARGADHATREYEALMRERYGAERTEQILSRNYHHTVVYPCLSIMSAFQQIRVVKPLGVDRTLMEIWHFNLRGAPEAFRARNMAYSNIVNSPATMIGCDDYETWWRCHEGLKSQTHDWVSLHRNCGDDYQDGDVTRSRVGTSEVFQRNQYRTWVDYMTGAGQP
jgi:phenylpropionate dioxygenase-like ring-hydroxylating dioxygenase large terminal subunit